MEKFDKLKQLFLDVFFKSDKKNIKGYQETENFMIKFFFNDSHDVFFLLGPLLATNKYHKELKD